jgi:gliding motility-associated-like protein
LQLVGSSQHASSIFLSIAPTDEKLNLSWNLQVPWQNDYYVIYRYNGATFDSIGFSNTTSYVDTGLVNGSTYCYYVMSHGAYPGPGFVNPILNNSQEMCASPYDNVPPCALSTDTASFDCVTREIVLTWNIPVDSCADDVNYYNIYSAANASGPFTILATITNGSINTFVYTNEISIAGCYYVTAVDTNGNEGAPGEMVCVDNCPYYELPNIFTPDGNNFNDLFVPFPYRYVQDVDFKVYSRWGLLVFETTDPAIGWNGKTDNTGAELPDGVYYYTCKVNEIYLAGIQSRKLTGAIQLLRELGHKNE